MTLGQQWGGAKGLPCWSHPPKTILTPTYHHDIGAQELGQELSHHTPPQH